MCLLRYVGCLADLGVRALKLEGRTKSGGYVAQIADVYRTALDRHARRGAGGPDCGKVEISTAALLEELFHTASRPLSTGFFLPRRRVEAPRPVCSPGPWWRGLRNRRATAGGCRCVPRGHRIVKRPFSCRGCGVRHFSPARISLKTTGEERVDLLHPGMEGVLHCEIDGLGKGLYVRA